MFHLIAAFKGEHEAQDIARRMSWEIKDKEPEQTSVAVEPEADSGPTFTQSDFENALRKVGRKITK
jgi:hypothetical protein